MKPLKKSSSARIKPRRPKSGGSARRPGNNGSHLRSIDKCLQMISDQQRKIEKLSEWRRRLSVLLRFNKRAATTTSIDELLQLLIEEARSVLNADRATLFLVDRKERQLWSKVASGTETIRVPIDKGIAGSVVTSGAILNISDVYKDPRFNPEVDRKTGYRTKAVLAAPMFSTKDQVIGVFQVLNPKNGRSFDQQDEEILTLLADQASGHVEKAQLYQEIRKATQSTIIRLAGAVEFKDHDTRAHLWRMSQYSAIVAGEMGFDSDWCENIRLAAPMHDIGKIGVPDAILNKPGKLTPEEWEEMRKHPTYGAEILKDGENELMQMAATIALCHHEKWDGSGYPRGLRGEDIPIEARIATIADVFDALTSRRIYKEAYSLSETLALINNDSGKHFDPGVVAAFLRALPRIRGIMETYAPRDGQSPPLPLPTW